MSDGFADEAPDWRQRTALEQRCRDWRPGDLRGQADAARPSVSDADMELEAGRSVYVLDRERVWEREAVAEWDELRDAEIRLLDRQLVYGSTDGDSWGAHDPPNLAALPVRHKRLPREQPAEANTLDRPRPCTSLSDHRLSPLRSSHGASVIFENRSSHRRCQWSATLPLCL